MKLHIKALIALLSLAAFSLTSCQTVQGFGRDLSASGTALSNAAERR